METLMQLEILHIPDCPNVVVLEQRIAQAVAGEHIDVAITRRRVDTLAEAVESGMTGSPTLLVDGTDPFGQPGLVPGLSCRLYPADGGGIDRAPSVAALRDALRRAATDTTTQAPAGAADCCTRTPPSPAERALHHAILRSFAASGGPPPNAALDVLAAQFDLPAQQLLDRLHTVDMIRLDPSGHIVAAYPFSAAPTAHRVRVAGAASGYAMCAIDALGISAMLGADVAIDSVDAATGQRISVIVGGQSATANPASTVVFIGMQSGHGPLAETCCNYLNFFSDRSTAEAWAKSHPHVEGTIVDLAAATQYGAAIFGPLLTTAGWTSGGSWPQPCAVRPRGSPRLAQHGDVCGDAARCTRGP